MATSRRLAHFAPDLEPSIGSGRAIAGDAGAAESCRGPSHAHETVLASLNSQRHLSILANLRASGPKGGKSHTKRGSVLQGALTALQLLAGCCPTHREQR